MSWTSVPKPSTSSYTSIGKPNVSAYTTIPKPVGSLTGLWPAGTATGLIMPPTRSYVTSVYTSAWTTINKPT